MRLAVLAADPKDFTAVPQYLQGICLVWSYETCQGLFYFRKYLKDKSGVGIIVEYSRDYTVVNDV